MAKYNNELKLMVVKEYLEGRLGYKLLAKKHDIPNHSTVLKWVKAYRSFGKDGLRRRHTKKVYSFQFKLDVLNFKKQTGASYQETAIEFNMNNPSLIANWNRTFLKEGLEGLKPKRKGSPSMSKRRELKHDKAKPQTELLKRENELLKLEIAYLKKLKAFQGNPDAYLEKSKQHWHSNSKKKDSN